MSSETTYKLKDLLYLMARLRTPVTGCPWDLKQSYKTIAPSTIEEAYEVVDAIEKEDFGHLKEELGDLLFQVVFYCQLAREEQRFEFDDIVQGLTEKLIRRHPHVFPEGTLDSVASADSAKNEESIKASWEAIKKQEREQKGKAKILDDVPVALPSMSRALKLQKRAATVNFDWPSADGVFDKVEEEVGELKDAVLSGDKEKTTEELGDLIFSVVNLARHLKVDPESALRMSNSKFERRFRFMENEVEKENRQLEDLSSDELESFWSLAKREL